MSPDDFQKLDWLEPWYFNLSGLEQELIREVSAKHPLYKIKALAVGRRKDNDDALFFLSGFQQPLAVVHLTWRHEDAADWPHTLFYKSIRDFVENRMKPDWAEYRR